MEMCRPFKDASFDTLGVWNDSFVEEFPFASMSNPSKKANLSKNFIAFFSNVALRNQSKAAFS